MTTYITPIFTPIEEPPLQPAITFTKVFLITSRFSDHAHGVTAPIVTMAPSAKVLEKYFIISDHILNGPSARLSLDKKEFTATVSTVRETEQLLDRIDNTISEKRIKGRNFFRALHICRNDQDNRGGFYQKEPPFHPTRPWSASETSCRYSWEKIQEEFPQRHPVELESDRITQSAKKS